MLSDKTRHIFRTLRGKKPLVLCLTNRVTTQRVADTILATGASPVMADHPQEVGQMLALADALYLNAGLQASQLPAFGAAAQALEATPRPVVLDPVGAGATAFRTAEIEKLLRLPFSVIRGNASEIRALAHDADDTHGVDSRSGSEEAVGAAHALHRTLGCVVAVSGERDLIVGERQTWVSGGHPWLTLVTGAGCALGGVVAACCAVASAEDAAIAAHEAYAVAASRAAAQARGPGSLSSLLLDELWCVGEAG